MDERHSLVSLVGEVGAEEGADLHGGEDRDHGVTALLAGRRARLAVLGVPLEAMNISKLMTKEKQKSMSER